jgi:hypothetical protein
MDRLSTSIWRAAPITARGVVAVIIAGGLLAACGGSGRSGGSKKTTTTSTPKTATVTPPSGKRPVKSEGPGYLTQVNVHYPAAPAALDTAPTVSPAVGGLTAVFAVHVTVHSTLGASGDFRRDYRVLLDGIRPRCAVFTELDAARLGSRATILLRPPIELGWCRGPYKGTVLLETNPSCPPPTSSSPPCHLFATRYQVVGRFSFVAR